MAAIHDSPEVVSCLLSYPEQEILLNKKNHNVLDAALNADRKNVLLAIASHERLVKKVNRSEERKYKHRHKLVPLFLRKSSSFAHVAFVRDVARIICTCIARDQHTPVTIMFF